MNRTRTATTLTTAAITGACTLAVLSAGSSAHAQSLPAPSSNGPGSVSNKPLINSGHKVTPVSVSTTASTISLRWEATKSFTTIQTSKKKPTFTKSGWKFPGAPVQPAVVKGKAIHKGDTASLTSGKSRYSFNQSISGLAERTGYYTVVTVPVGPGYKPVQQAWFNKTKLKNTNLSAPKVRVVKMTVDSVKVIKDGDTGIRGKGEVRFGARLAPEANPLVASEWGNWSHNWNDYTKANNGDRVTFRTPLTHTINTTKSTAFVEVQGYENDVESWDYCAIEGGPKTAQQYSDKCFDAAVAVASLKLNTKAGKKTTQYVTAKVYRGPALQFSATVKVQSWFK